MIYPRTGGILLHITSLPGKYGIGEIGPEAFHFIDRLSKMGQRLWQILPLGDPGTGNCPYNTVSAFANNPMLISFDALIEEGYLNRNDLNGLKKYPVHKYDAKKVAPDRAHILNTVCKRFSKCASEEKKAALEVFCEKNDYWLDDYSIFTVLKDAHDGVAWMDWDPKYAHREDNAMQSARHQYEAAIQRQKIAQFLFDGQWNRLRKYAHEKGVKMGCTQ